MGKRFISFFLILALFCFSAGAETLPPSSEEVTRALSVITDCLTAGLAVQYSQSSVSLPSCSVSMNTETSLPVRVSFFMTDPAMIASTIGQYLGASSNILTSVFSFLKKAVDDPILSTVYLSLDRKGYTPSDFLLSGSISIKYPENFSFDSLSNILEAKADILNGIVLSTNLNLLGQKIAVPLQMKGDFVLSVEGNSIVAKSVSVYNINNFYYSNAVFRF